MRILVALLLVLGTAKAESNKRPTFVVLHKLPGIDVVESTNHGRHMHGGPAASIGEASIRFQVTDKRAHKVSVTRLEFLDGHCRETTWSSRKRLKIVGHAAHDWDNVDPIATGKTGVTLPAVPDLYSVEVSFPPISAYQACDRFAFAVRIVVDGKRLDLEVPLEIKRYEPLRKQPGTP